MTELTRIIKKAERQEKLEYPGTIRLKDIYDFMAYLQKWDWKVCEPRNPDELLYMVYPGLSISIRWNEKIHRTTTNKSGYCHYLLWQAKIGLSRE